MVTTKKLKENAALKKEKIWVLSLGGSLIFPDTIDIAFLRKFRDFLVKMIAKGNKFVLVCGGGALCRVYQRAASEVVEVHPDDLDWIGVHVTRINAHLMRTIFRDVAHRVVIKDPNEPFEFKDDVLIVAGWKPGWSTDYDAVLLAKRLGSKTVVNLSNIDYLYDQDPRHTKSAKPISAISWEEFIRMIGTKWIPGMNLPFDPIASRAAAQEGLKVVLCHGQDIKNLEKLFTAKSFKGTIIG